MIVEMSEYIQIFKQATPGNILHGTYLVETWHQCYQSE